MTSAKVIRYSTTSEAADDNAALVRDVYAELAADAPDGLRYVTFRLDDGVSFVHIALLDEDDNPLTRSAAFAAFQAELGSRLAGPPVARDATIVGSYGFGLTSSPD